MRHRLPILLTAALVGTTTAADLVPGVTVDGHGQLNAGGVRLALVHFAPGWRLTGQGAVRGTPTIGADWKLNGSWPVHGGSAFAFEQNLSPIDATALRYRMAVTSDRAVPSNALSFSVSLPVDRFAERILRFDEKTVSLPREITEGGIFDGTVGELAIPTDGGLLTISGTLSCHVQDDRQWDGGTYSVRIAIASGEVTQAQAEYTIRYAPYVVHPVDLKPAANMAWADETADDGKGGWTDQGPDNDLRAIKPGEHRLANVPFRLVDPAANAGKSAIVLAGTQRPGFPAKATVAIPDASDRHLYLLHASAWTPSAGTAVGSLRIRYSDGTEEVRDLTAGRDLGNWWAPSSLANGVVAWTAENTSAYIGLYCSHVPLAKAATEVVLESSGKAVWMVAAMTAAPDAIPLPKEGPHYIIANDGWRPITSAIDVEKGSILDLSGLLDAPAGKYGQVIAKDGRFVFADAPDKRIRFYGTNFCFSANFPSHEQSDAIAERMAREGYNTVRLHHYDWDITTKDEQDSTILDPKQLDRFHYLIHALEQRGLYISIDLFTFRQIRPGEVTEVEGISRNGYKAAVVFLDSAMTNWQTFTRALLTAPNPYSGRSLAEDPALVGICPVNEDTIWSVINEHAGVRDLARERFAAWLDQRGTTPADDAERESLWTQFLSEAQIAANRRMTAFIRNLGCRAPVTGVNFITTMNLVPTRADRSFDFVDNHAYWDHPGFPEKPWSLPMSFQNRSAVEAGAGVPRGLMPGRVVGKPYTVTEFNYVFPNQYRAEGGPLIGAYAALQDWDGLWRFAHAHALENLVSLRRTGGFDLGTDPLNRLSERLGVLCFLRGDVAPAKGRVVLAVDDASAYAGKTGWGGSPFPTGFDWLGLHTAIATAHGDAPIPSDPVVLAPERIALPAGTRRVDPDQDLVAGLVAAGTVPAGAVDAAAERVVSDTGELRIDGNAGLFQAVTARSEHFVLSKGGTASGGLVQINVDARPTTVGVAAMDDQPLATSTRLLVLHLTNLANTRTRFRGKAMTLLESLGDLPHLVHAGRAEIRLTLPGTFTAWACDVTGKRLREVPLRRDGEMLILVSDQTQGDEPAMVYELVRD